MTSQPPISIQQEQETYVRQDGTTFTRADIFVKLSVTFRDGMLRALKGPPLSVYLCIALHCGNKNMTAWPSLKRIIAETGYSNRAVIDAIHTLEKAELVQVQRKAGGQKGNEVNHYEVKGYATMGASELGSLGVVNDVHKGSEPSSHEEESMEEESILEDQESATADTHAPPTLVPFKVIQEAIENAQGKKGGGQAVVRKMLERLYPGLEPPSFQYIAKTANKMGGYVILAEWLWVCNVHNVKGDRLAYAYTAWKGRNNGQRRSSSRSASAPPLSAQSQAIADALQFGAPGRQDVPALSGAARTRDP